MNRHIYKGGFLLLPLLFAFAPDWFSFISKEQNFKVAFPVQPRHQQQDSKTEVGTLAMHIYSYDASATGKDDNMVYMVMTTQYPVESKISSDNKEIIPKLFRGGIDGAAKNVHGTLLSEKEITIKGYPGREIKIGLSQDIGAVTCRMYLIKNRMYMVQVITEKKKENNASIAKFLNSFDILHV